jgi:O-antigen ligase
LNVSRWFAVLAAWLAILWIAGGASRADVIGQTITRGAAWAILILLILFARKPDWQPVRPVALFLAAVVVLVLIQLVPLPPSVWMALPGRHVLAEVAVASGQAQPWRPISVSPGATRNSLSALIVPVVTLILMAGLRPSDRRLTPALLLALILASSILGLLQFSGAGFNNPFINDVPGMVSASFANRNHFALFCAVGCLLAPAWGFQDRHGTGWKGPAAIALLLFFGLMILATGSRAGLFVGAAGIGIGFLAARRAILRELGRLPRWASALLVGGLIALAIAFVALSLYTDRAVGLERIISLEPSQDLRRQALPTVLMMVIKYFPFGAGMGTFDPIYRISEPTRLLNISYFNHAHDDLVELVLEAGIFAVILLFAALAWWVWRSAIAWRANRSTAVLPQIGSGVLLLVIIASVWDFPARTPMMMAIIVMSAAWLSYPVQPLQEERPATG